MLTLTMIEEFDLHTTGPVAGTVNWPASHGLVHSAATASNATHLPAGQALQFAVAPFEEAVAHVSRNLPRH